MRGEHALPPSRLIAEILQTLVPDAHLAIVAGAGHMGPLTHAAQVNAAIMRHIADAEAKSRQGSPLTVMPSRDRVAARYGEEAVA
jgi:hypothetical protein